MTLRHGSLESCTFCKTTFAPSSCFELFQCCLLLRCNDTSLTRERSSEQDGDHTACQNAKLVCSML